MQEYYSRLGRRTAVPLRANAASIAAFSPRPAARNEERSNIVWWRLRTYAITDAENVVHRLGYVLHKSKEILAHSETFLDTAYSPMLGGSLVTTAWRVLRLRMEGTPSRYGG
jgi:hypothetical protein